MNQFVVLKSNLFVSASLVTHNLGVKLRIWQTGNKSWNAPIVKQYKMFQYGNKYQRIKSWTGRTVLRKSSVNVDDGFYKHADGM